MWLGLITISSLFTKCADEPGSLLPVVKELNQRGWLNKIVTTRKGIIKGGTEITRTSLWQLLTNPLYAGKVRYKTEVHKGEHEAIVDEVLWKRVQTIMACNSGNGGREVKNRHGSILRGLLQCTPCGCAMTPSYATKNQKVALSLLHLRQSPKARLGKVPF